MVSLLKNASFGINLLALFVAAFIIFKNLIKGIYQEKRYRAHELAYKEGKIKG
ncbi:MAG: hypothetical protein LM579_01510 [Thermodesulfobacterium sp.]|nr:hypothetical protein [Thermodesulfobacterium sp.]